MLDRLVSNLQFQGQALQLRAERQKVLAGNIANTDTPGFQARDFDFASALRQATGMAAPGGSPALAPLRVSAAKQAGHIPLGGAVSEPGTTRLAYRMPDQPSIDGNTVDLDRERANFADNSVRYEATLRFINGHVRTVLSAIRGE